MPAVPAPLQIILQAMNLPAEYQKLQHTNRTPVPVSLQVAQTAPNSWGIGRYAW